MLSEVLARLNSPSTVIVIPNQKMHYLSFKVVVVVVVVEVVNTSRVVRLNYSLILLT